MRISRVLLVPFALSLLVVSIIYMSRNTDVSKPDATFRSECEGISHFPNISAVPVQDRWRRVYEKYMYTYSAYFDSRTSKNRVVILGISRNDTTDQMWCQLWYQHRMVAVEAEVYLHPETHHKKYVGSFHFCDVSSSPPAPIAVSLVPEPCAVTPGNPIIVRSTGQYNSDHLVNQSYQYNYTVCFSPFHSHTNNVQQLVSAIEANRMFGADHFIFYHHSPGDAVLKAVEYYVAQGLAEIFPWRVPVVTSLRNPAVHYFAQVVSVNDCMYRSMRHSAHVVISDLDELIVPQREKTWDALLHHERPLNPSPQDRPQDRPQECVWEFRNAFFRFDFPDDSGADPRAKANNIVPLLKTKRERRVFPFRDRTKTILRPQLVTVAGIHFIFKKLDDRCKVVRVDPSEALVHHYRWVRLNFRDDSMVEHKVMLKYTEEIVSRVTRILGQIK